MLNFRILLALFFLPVLLPGQARETVAVDTIFPEIFASRCADTPVVFATTQGGYVFGSNPFFDLVKLQRIAFNRADSFLITGVVVAFGAVEEGIGDRYVSAVVYDDISSDGNFGDFLAESDSVLVSDIRLDSTEILYTYFNFPEPVRIDDPSFLVGVDFSRTYRRDAPAYIGMYSTNDRCGSGLNAFDIFVNSSGQGVFAVVQDRWGANAEILIGAVIDTDFSTATSPPLANYPLTVAPNPADELVRFEWGLAAGRVSFLSILDVSGKVVLRRQVSSRAATVDVSDLAGGMYYFRLEGEKGIRTGKVVVR